MWFRGKVNLLIAVLVALVSARTATADVRLAAIFSPHMVLQRDREIPVWGFAQPGEKIAVSLADKSAEVNADAAGRWIVKLPALLAGGPHRLEVKATNALTVDDVYIGEVWICAGQTNMQWALSASTDAEKEVAAADYPKIRMFTVGKEASDNRQPDCKGAWQVCSPASSSTFSAVGYYFGRELHRELDVPIGMIHASWGGTVCEAWAAKESLQKEKEFEPLLKRSAETKEGPNRASVIYNGMIAPLVPYGIRGVIWYQGESNVGRAAQYGRLLPTLIRNWRSDWGEGDFPFLYVQLTPFRYERHDAQSCAELWDAQLKTLSVPNTGMVVTSDLTDLKEINPRNKQDVGKRLARWALATTYEKKEIVYSGPLYKSMRIDGGKIRIAFDHLGGGLMARDGQPLSEFTIAGADEKFVPAKAQIDGDEVVVWCDAVPSPAAVRFAFHDTAQGNLVNKAGLPASPFRTDAWKLLTEGNL